MSTDRAKRSLLRPSTHDDSAPSTAPTVSRTADLVPAIDDKRERRSRRLLRDEWGTLRAPLADGRLGARMDRANAHWRPSDADPTAAPPCGVSDLAPALPRQPD